MEVAWFIKINSGRTHNGEFYQFRGEQSNIISKSFRAGQGFVQGASVYIYTLAPCTEDK
jgi:hypothetical protein